MKKILENKFIKELIPYLIIIVSVIIFRTFIATPVEVIGDSMYDTLKDKEVLILNKFIYYFKDIERFDIVVIKEEDKIIKRIIGLPGDYIEYKNNILYINGKKIDNDYANSITKDFKLEDICNCTKIPEGYYLVLGDNRMVSKDSRSYGLISEKLILGKVNIRLWPINKFGAVK